MSTRLLSTPHDNPPMRAGSRASNDARPPSGRMSPVGALPRSDNSIGARSAQSQRDDDSAGSARTSGIASESPSDQLQGCESTSLSSTSLEQSRGQQGSGDLRTTTGADTGTPAGERSGAPFAATAPTQQQQPPSEAKDAPGDFGQTTEADLRAQVRFCCCCCLLDRGSARLKYAGRTSEWCLERITCT